ncbi:hypothetical protein ACFWIA_20055 [Streptomyces sp. NPDC127068]|uniref:hypothetical protein n=1 Tax=Streptomyces sp. NPDC127068 TaxID=3347127 RepID=UPI0036576D73
MVTCTYFSASDDESALGVLDGFGGPDSTTFDVVSLKGIDPVVVIAQLEAVLTACTYEEARQRPRSGQLLSSPEAEDAFVVSVSGTLQEALASATPPSLSEAAGPWCASDELQDLGTTPEEATEVLERLAGLAGRARATSSRLYCWWAL